MRAITALGTTHLFRLLSAPQTGQLNTRNAAFAIPLLFRTNGRFSIAIPLSPCFSYTDDRPGREVNSFFQEFRKQSADEAPGKQVDF